MKTDYIDRSMMVIEEFEDEAVRIEALKIQTRMAIEEATAKNLFMQAKLRESLKDVEPNDMEAIQAMKALCDLQRNWDQLNNLYEEVTWRPPMPWDEDYEAMEQLMAIVQQVRGKK